MYIQHTGWDKFSNRWWKKSMESNKWSHGGVANICEWYWIIIHKNQGKNCAETVFEITRSPSAAGEHDTNDVDVWASEIIGVQHVGNISQLQLMPLCKGNFAVQCHKTYCQTVRKWVGEPVSRVDSTKWLRIILGSHFTISCRIFAWKRLLVGKQTYRILFTDPLYLRLPRKSYNHSLDSSEALRRKNGYSQPPSLGRKHTVWPSENKTLHCRKHQQKSLFLF